jgi:hypothetical protein
MWELDLAIVKHHMEFSCVDTEAVTLHEVCGLVNVWNPEGGETKVSEPRAAAKAESKKLHQEK